MCFFGGWQLLVGLSLKYKKDRSYTCRKRIVTDKHRLIDMTAYANFVSDFPNRCRKVLTFYDSSSRKNGHDVTFLLGIATTGVCVPYDRLKQPSPVFGPHPSGNRDQFDDAAKKFDGLCSSFFLQSPLSSPLTSSWKFGSLFSTKGDPDSWKELQNATSVSEKETCKDLLEVIRNALAHGNIWTMGDPISELVLVSKPKPRKNTPPYRFLVVTPPSLQDFLNHWFDFLSGLIIPEEPIGDEEAPQESLG